MNNKSLQDVIAQLKKEQAEYGAKNRIKKPLFHSEEVEDVYVAGLSRGGYFALESAINQLSKIAIAQEENHAS